MHIWICMYVCMNVYIYLVGAILFSFTCHYSHHENGNLCFTAYLTSHFTSLFLIHMHLVAPPVYITPILLPSGSPHGMFVFHISRVIPTSMRHLRHFGDWFGPSPPPQLPERTIWSIGHLPLFLLHLHPLLWGLCYSISHIKKNLLTKYGFNVQPSTVKP